jgi:hypothetical protein
MLPTAVKGELAAVAVALVDRDVRDLRGAAETKATARIKSENATMRFMACSPESEFGP